MLSTPQIKRHTQTENKGIEKIVHANGNKKNQGNNTYTRGEKKDFKAKVVIRDKEGYFIIIYSI